ncbi:unnamed protein product, partial [Symbiodinium sp. CCMP2456]
AVVWPSLAESWDEAELPLGKWTATALGSESAVDPEGPPPEVMEQTERTARWADLGDTVSEEPAEPDGAQDAEADLDDELNDDEKAEVRRIEKECTDLEKQLRGLTATQQRAFLERLADNSVPVVGGLLADTLTRTARLRDRGQAVPTQAIRASQATADQDPKYLVQRAPGALPPMMSLGHEHRLRLLRRLHELERAGVEWTQEEIEASLTMEQFLDYIEEREQEKADRRSFDNSFKGSWTSHWRWNRPRDTSSCRTSCRATAWRYRPGDTSSSTRARGDPGNARSEARANSKE